MTQTLQINSSQFFLPADLLKFKKTKTLILVSGGADSVFLFYLFKNLFIKYQIQFEVLHFNHHLRGQESDAEQVFVETLCSKNHVLCHTRHLKFDSKSALQNKARLLRYRESLGVCKKGRFLYIATAHHKDDFLETVIIKNKRGAGLKGFTGIRNARQIAKKTPHVTLIRPLLPLSKKEILDCLHQNKIPFCTDSSNLKKKYLRNRVRIDILNKWDNDSQKNSVFKIATRLQYVDVYFDKRLKFALSQYNHFIPISIWNSWPSELKFRFFALKMRQKGFLKQVETRHFEAINHANHANQVKLKLDKACFFKDRSGCFFYSEHELKNLSHYKFLINKPGCYFLSEWACKIDMKSLHKINVKNLLSLQNKLLINSNKVELPLFITYPRSNDLFRPFGKKRPISLTDFFRARQIPRFQRQFWPVLRCKSELSSLSAQTKLIPEGCGHHEIIAVIGLEISDSVKITNIEKGELAFCLPKITGKA